MMIIEYEELYLQLHNESILLRGRMQFPIEAIHKKIIQCQSCPRLREYCGEIALTKRKAYQDDVYWGQPVPGFGDPLGRLMIVGLAPGAHGANRTGRVFTGDRSGEWLYRALHKAGFANQPQSVGRDDGLKLQGAYITCVVKCAPPNNKPSLEEQRQCIGFLGEELLELKNTRVWMALGQLAYDHLWRLLAAESRRKKPPFKHGEKIDLGSSRFLILSYHPSQQNTFTGKLTEPMFDQVFTLARECLAKN